MKIKLLFVISMMLLFPMITCNSFAFEKHLSPTEAAVWQKEVQYWKLLKEDKLDDFMKLWHPDFRGWPVYADDPGDKELIRTATESALKAVEPGTLVVELDRRDVHAAHDIVTTFYVYSYAFTAKGSCQENRNADQTCNTVSQSGRIFHSWVRHKGDWVILNGGSSQVENYKSTLVTPRKN